MVRTAKVLLLFLLLTPALALKPEAAKHLSQAQALMSEAKQTYQKHFPDKPLWSEAINQATQAAKIDPQDPEVWRTLAEIYTATGWWSRAEEAWKKYLSLVGDKDTAPLAEALRALGFLAYQRGDVKASLDYFKRSLELEPNNTEALAWLGRIYMEQGNGAKAAKYWQQAARLDPSPRNLYFAKQAKKMAAYGGEAVRAFYQGYAAWEDKDYASAIVSFETAARLAPDWAEAHRWLARVYMEAGMPARAIPHWEKVLQLAGPSPDVQHFLKLAKEAAGVGLSAADSFFKGVAAYDAGKTAEAERWFKMATEADPGYVKAWRWLGRVYYESGRYAEAAAAYQKALELDPNDASSRYFLRLAKKASGK
ncbi:tetratricopeptide repeat protein [Oceanithermus sp.]